MMNYAITFKWVFVALQIIGVLLTVAQVGKSRKPLTGGDAVSAIIFNGLIVWAFLEWFGR